MASIISKIAKLLGHESNRNNNKKRKTKPSDYDEDYLRFDSTKLIKDPSTGDDFYRKNRYQKIDSVEVMAKKMGLFSSKELNRLFEEKIIYRGRDYFFKDRISNYVQDGNNYKCNVQGTKTYNCELTINGNEVKNMKCDCEYYKSGNNCKHLYALLFKAKLRENLDKLMTKANEIITEAHSIIDEGKKLVKNYNLIIDLSDLSYMLNIYEEKINEFSQKLSTIGSESLFLSELRFIINVNMYYKERLKVIYQVIDDYNAGKYKGANISPDAQKQNRKNKGKNDKQKNEENIITYNSNNLNDLDEEDIDDWDDDDDEDFDDIDDLDDDFEEFDDDFVPRKKKGFFDIDQDDFFRAMILKDLFKD